MLGTGLSVRYSKPPPLGGGRSLIGITAWGCFSGDDDDDADDDVDDDDDSDDDDSDDDDDTSDDDALPAMYGRIPLLI